MRRFLGIAVGLGAVVAIGFIWFHAHLAVAVQLAGLRHPLRCLAATVFAAAAAYWICRRYGTRLLNGSAATVTVIGGLALPFVAYGFLIGYEQRAHGVIADYCRYGAVSKAQLGECLAHVTEKQVYRRDTDAAKFATREIDVCLGDSGPFCGDALNWRLQNDENPGP